MSYQLSEVRESINGGRQRTQLVVADDEDPQEWELEHRWGQTGQKVATVKMSKHRSASLGVTSDPDISQKQHRKVFYRRRTNCVDAHFGCQLRSDYSGNSASFEGSINVTRIVVTETSGTMPTPSLLAWVE